MPRLCASLLCLIAAGCALHRPPPPVAREFRAAWVATVANIDWPSKPGLSSEQQQWEMRQILDKAQAIGLNAIIFQVRTSCDAMYPSPYEPWSYYLTGQQGKPPDYDPLELWVAEAHRRGLELHAWFNPFRAKPPSATYALDASHIANRQPDLARRYGSVMWLDPGEPAAQDYTIQVMTDVVRRYDVDGIHIDDYFYPYPENDKAGKPMDFPDEPSWRRYQDAGGTLSRGDWRRQNINQLVRRMYTQTKALKPWVKVGISPFGIWKPGYPPVVKGFNQYESIYADAKLWLNEGWCDYFTPQLYWKTTAPSQPFEPLLKWWIGENRLSRHVWPGLFTSRIEPSKPPTTGPTTRRATTTAASDRVWTPHEILDQIAVARRTPGATGHVHFSMVTLAQDRQDVDEQLAHAYAEPALVPASPWLGGGGKKLAAPKVAARLERGNVIVSWTAAEEPWLWVVRVRFGGRWVTRIAPGAQRQMEVLNDQNAAAPSRVIVSGVDRVGNEGSAGRSEVAKER